MDIMLSQSCGKILVGDPHQQIYTFRGAVNALHAVPHTHLYYLTQVHTYMITVLALPVHAILNLYLL